MGKKYFQAVGRRKTARAVVKIFPDEERQILINGKSFQVYFPLVEHQKIITQPLDLLDLKEKFKILAEVKGGGISAQAEAIRLGISRALVLYNPDFRKKLKKIGFLKRDPRAKERKKFGLKRARRAPQWQKR